MNHTDAHPAETFGAFVRRVRRAAGLSLEALASALGYSKTFLNDVERDQRPASRAFCDVVGAGLGLDRVDVYARAGHLTIEVEAYLMRRPRALALFERLARADADDARLEALMEALPFPDPEAVHGVAGDPRPPITRQEPPGPARS